MSSHPVPRSVPVQRRVRACMLAYTFYENDARVIRYAEALVGSGAEVDAIVLRREGTVTQEVMNGVRVLRIQRRDKNERGKFAYFRRVMQFFFRSMIEVTRRHAQAPYDVIHVHSVPDFEVFAAFVPKLKGAKVVLDIHDIVPEFYAAKFKVSERSMVFSALKWIERISAAFADHVIIANDLWRQKITARSCSDHKCSALINYPDAGIFNPDLRDRRDDGKFVVMYPGTLNHHQGLDIAIRAFALVAPRAPDMEFHIHGEGSARESLAKLINDLDLSDRVYLNPPRPLRQIATVMSNADLGVVPKRNDAFGGDAFSTKTLEFMADTRVDKFYFNESLVRFFRAGEVEDLARALLDAYTDRPRSVRLAAQALEFARQNSWAHKKNDYLALIARLVHE
jgi:glycosyltransferase involved in cell wall biosynthesis